MCTWELLTFMDWFYVCLKVYLNIECGSTMCAWELLAFMDRIYVSLKFWFLREWGSTLTTRKLLAFMDWFYMILKVSFLSECWSTMNNDCMGTFVLHVLISNESEGALYVLLYNHIVNIDDVSVPFWIGWGNVWPKYQKCQMNQDLIIPKVKINLMIVLDTCLQTTRLGWRD